MAKQHNTTSRPLVIVESPNKVKTISRILGKGFVVRASYGHFADIAANNKAVDIANGFDAPYFLTPKGRDIIESLKADLASASELILATDDDREGEMIAHLLVHFLSPTVPVSRIVFHAITPADVTEALAHRRSVNANLVEAARARRVLDHLYGFQVSQVLWSKVRQYIGVGRVQGPALRLVVERERERLVFVETTYAAVAATFNLPPEVEWKLSTIDGVKVAASTDIDDAGRVTGSARLLMLDEARRLVDALADESFIVSSIKTQKYTRKPRRPYITSDLLQDVMGRLRVSSKVAQSLMNQLHEKGLISYPRTDNPSLSTTVTAMARETAVSLFGPNAVPDTPRRYFGKKKNAQEAHEAIRPTDLSNPLPSGLSAQQQVVYELVWRRTVASQMRDATGTTYTVTFTVTASTGETCEFIASGTTISEPGHRRLAFGWSGETPTPLESLTEGEVFKRPGFDVSEHVTKPPARFTEASLIAALEDLEIGRPSTYATAMDSLRDEYLWSKDGEAGLIPTLTGVAVDKFMGDCFPKLVDFEFTREMEDRLSRIVEGEDSFTGVLGTFYNQGDDQWPSLEETIASAMDEYDPRLHPVMTIGTHPRTGEELLLFPGKTWKSKRAKTPKKGRGRSGSTSSGSPYVRCGARTVGVPDQTELSTLTVDHVVSLLDAPRVERSLGTHEGEEVVVRTGPYGPYLSRGSGKISLPDTFDPGTVELDDVAHLLAFPRLLGVDPADGVEVVVKLGRYGAYVDKAGETRSAGSPDDGAVITLDAALALLAQEKKRRGRR